MHIELKRYLSTLASVARLAEAYGDLISLRDTTPERAIRARGYLGITLRRFLNPAGEVLRPSAALVADLRDRALSFEIGCELQMIGDLWERYLDDWDDARCTAQLEAFRRDTAATLAQILGCLDRLRCWLDRARRLERLPLPLAA